MESTELTKVNLSPLRGQEVAARAPAATPSGSLGSLAFLPSSFGGARLRPSARTIAAGSGLVCAPPSLGAVRRVGVLLAAFSRAGLACFRGVPAAALQM